MADRIRCRRIPLIKLLSVAAMSLLLVSCGGSDAATENGNGDDATDGPPANEAQAIFIEVGCAECHGDQGQGIEGRGKALTGTRMIQNAFQTRVRHGRGQQMPGFSEEQISDEEIEMIRLWLSGQ